MSLVRSSAVALVIALSACGATAPGATAPTDTVEMRTWELPPGQTDRLVSSLNRVLVQRHGDTTVNVGKAVEGPSGALVVVAPPGVLDGVEALVQRVNSATPLPPPQNVELEYWVVLGEAGGEDRAPQLDEVSAALDAIVQADGAQSFSLRAARSMRTLDGERGWLEDAALEAQQVVAIEPGTDTIIANLDIGLRDVHGGSKVSTQLALKSGEVAVLSQTGVRVGGERSANVYLLVRPTIR